MCAKRGIRCFAACLPALIILSACSGSPSSPPSPTLSPDLTFAPETAAPAENARIAVPSFNGKGEYDALTRRLNDALKAAGQAVEFDVQYLVNPDSGDNVILTKAQSDIASGTAADAYAMSRVDSLALYKGNRMMDVTGIVKTYAPIFYSKYKGIFDDALTGIPAGIFSRPLVFKKCLMIRKGFAEDAKGVGTVDGLFKFLDDVNAGGGAKRVVQASPEYLVSQWALESGYYELLRYNVNGFLYADAGDPECTPVPLEKIPGLESFMRRMMPYYRNGLLDYTAEHAADENVVGFVRDIGFYYTSSAYGAWMTWIPGGYSAQAFGPELPYYSIAPCYEYELAIPSACPEPSAANVARFVEWYNSTQDNYDTVFYGERGADYTVSGSRFTPLAQGEPQDLMNAQQRRALFFCWPGASMLGNADYFRLPSTVPENVEKLEEAGRAGGLRFEADGKLSGKKSETDLPGIAQEFRDISSARDEELIDLILNPGAYTDDSFRRCMDRLAGIDTEKLIKEYVRIMGSD